MVKIHITIPAMPEQDVEWEICTHYKEYHYLLLDSI